MVDTTKVRVEMLTLLRYCLVGTFGFVIVSVITITLEKSFTGYTEFSYAIALLVLYVADYLVNLKFVYRSNHRHEKLFLYSLYLVVSWLGGTGLFSLIFNFVGSVITSNALTLVILFPIRYMASRKLLRE
jgi:putative flippase GtrA